MKSDNGNGIRDNQNYQERMAFLIGHFGTMNQAIKDGIQFHQDHPGCGPQDELIKYAVSEWIWLLWRNMRQAHEQMPEDQQDVDQLILEFLAKLTK